MSIDKTQHILMNIHKIGLPVSGIISEVREQQLSKKELAERPKWARLPSLQVKIDSPLPATLPAHRLVNHPRELEALQLPMVGDPITAIVENFVDGSLILSARPKELQSEAIASWKHYHDFINYLEIGDEIEGTVVRSEPFGLVLDIGGPGLGIIDVALMKNSPGIPLSKERDNWPKPGEKIFVCVNDFRLGNKQVAVGWLG
ncbi:MAG: S1 RNA-binding domain-containing protein [Calditrichota bacterium]